MFHIVDDDVMVGAVLAELIREFGHTVHHFRSPIEYLELIKTPEYISPIAIFSDVRMPHMSGYDFMHQVKQVNPLQKFVMITGTPELEHTYKHLACIYLCKPFVPEALKSISAILMHCQYECCLKSNEHIDDKNKFNINGWSCPHSSHRKCEG